MKTFNNLHVAYGLYRRSAFKILARNISVIGILIRITRYIYRKSLKNLPYCDSDMWYYAPDAAPISRAPAL